MEQTKPAQVFVPGDQDKIAGLLEGIYRQNVWPSDQIIEAAPFIGKKQGYNYRIETPWPHINNEIKYALSKIFKEKRLAASRGNADSLQIIVRFLSAQKHIASLLSNSIEKWRTKLQTFLIQEGKDPFRLITRSHKYRTGETYRVRHNSIRLFNYIYDILVDYYNPLSPWSRSVIDLGQVCQKGDKAKPYSVRMSDIQQEWLRTALIDYLKFRSRKLAPGTLRGHFTQVLRLSRFLAKEWPNINPTKIDRAVLESYIGFVKQLVKDGFLDTNVGLNAISCVKTFIEISQKRSFLTLGATAIFYRGDLLKRKDSEPRWIPEYIIKQIILHLQRLPLKWRLILMLQLESGARIGELLSLQINCLTKDNDGDYWLKRFVSKQSKWHSVPVAPEIVALIFEWGAIIKEKYGNSTNLLFPNVQGSRPVSQPTYQKNINKFIKSNDIRNEDGTLWYFESHSCRHTIATRMLDQGLSLHFISEFIGHDSPEMTRVYAAIKKAHLHEISNRVHARREAKVDDKIVSNWDVQDIVVSKLVRKHLITQRLSNGWCQLSVHQASCISAVACLDCIEHFETTPEFLPVHHQNLKDEVEILRIAHEKGYEQQIRGTENTIAKLLAVIERLEGITDNVLPEGPTE